MNSYGLSDIVLAFIAVALLVVMVDQVTRVLQAIMVKVPYLPDRFEMPIAYILLVAIASAICWQGHFDLFTLLGFQWWQNPWLGWIITGAIIAGGSTLLKKQFNMIGLMPSILSGVASTFGWGGGYSATDTIDTTEKITDEELNQSD